MGKLDSFKIKFIPYEVKRQGYNFPPVTPEDRLILRNTIFSVMENDYVISGEKDCDTMKKIALSCYDKSGKGFHGIAIEVSERIKARKWLYASDLFKSTDGFDFYINSKKVEQKSACGAWLYSHGSLDEARKEYEKSGEYIKWDYIYHAKNEKEFSFAIHIFCTWRQFFRYLDTYENGYKTFFKFNKIKSQTTGINVYEMNTLKTSKKKVEFLRRFTIL